MAKEIQSDEFKKLLSLGEEKGFLTYDDVNDMLPPDLNSSEQIDDIIMLFGEKNIDIIDMEQGEKLVVKKTGRGCAAVQISRSPRAGSRRGQNRRPGQDVFAGNGAGVAPEPRR